MTRTLGMPPLRPSFLPLLALSLFNACSSDAPTVSSNDLDAGGANDAVAIDVLSIDAATSDSGAVVDGATPIVHGKDIGPANTGAPIGLSLAAVSGSVKLDQAGAVWEAKELTGTIVVTADNVTIRNCKIHSTGYFGIRNEGGKNLVVEHCEIDGQAPGQYTGVVGSDVIVRRCNLHGFENPLVVEDRDVVEENYIHDLFYEGERHPDGMEWGSGGSGSIVRRNHIVIGPHTACINVTPYSGGTASNTVIEDNLLAGGTFPLYVRGDGGGTVTGVKVTGNVFVKGSYAYGTHSIVSATSVTWSNNSLDDGTPVSL